MSEKQRSSKTRTFAITVTTTPQKAFTNNPSRKSAFIINYGSYTAYLLSAQNLPYIEGTPIEAGDWIEDDSSTGELWLVTASNSSDCRCKEDSD